MFASFLGLCCDVCKSCVRLLVSQVEPAVEGISFRVCPEKAKKWVAQLDAAIAHKRLDSGAAQKLSGRLMWATQRLFHRVGRAMIKPIFAQKGSSDGLAGLRLLSAMRWWRSVLAEGVSELRQWYEAELRPCHLFVDAASTPARCAAVLFLDGEVLYTDGPPAQCLMSQFVSRGDKQIMTLVCDPVCFY